MTDTHPLHATPPSDRTIAREAVPTAAAAEQVEMTCRAQWEASAELREQFSLGGFESWVAFSRAQPGEAKRLLSALAPAPTPISSPLPPASTAVTTKANEDPQLRTLLDKLDGVIFATQIGDRARMGAAVEPARPQTMLEMEVKP